MWVGGGAWTDVRFVVEGNFTNSAPAIPIPSLVVSELPGHPGRRHARSRYEFARCHGESGIPDLLYPRTKFPSEYCTPIHDSLVNPVRGYNIRVVN